MSEDGKNFLIAVFDPFHDQAILTRGWPDGQNGKSLVRQLRNMVSVESPFASGISWECVVIRWPCAQTCPYRQTTSREGSTLGVLTGAGETIGAITVHAMQTSVGAYLPIGAPSACPILAYLEVPASYMVGDSRLIADGFEVVDATAPLYQQGTLTIFRSAQSSDESPTCFFMGDGATFSGNLPAVVKRMPPTTLSDAQKNDGSLTWETKRGCYVPSVFMSEQNPPTRAGPNCILFQPGDDTPSGVTSTQAIGYPEIVVATIVASWCTAKYQQHPAPVQISGAWLSGLSEFSKIVITNRSFIESFPLSTSSDLPLAKPSPEYDPFAMMIYSEANKHLPVGVYQGDNPLGEWFETIAKEVANVLQYIPHPLAQAGAMAAKGIGKGFEHYNRSQNLPRKDYNARLASAGTNSLGKNKQLYIAAATPQKKASGNQAKPKQQQPNIVQQKPQNSNLVKRI